MRRDINAKGIRRYADGIRAQQGGVKSVRPSCPNCQQLMMLRTNQATGTRFWGCRLYPNCTGTREVNTGR
jgi:ssDNA-binding Zn-finger/Zn-ribbon topoisomerase 1